eukprot:TCONS_00063032-protein
MDLHCDEVLINKSKKVELETSLKNIKQEEIDDDCTIIPPPEIIPETQIKKEANDWPVSMETPSHLINIKLEDLSHEEYYEKNNNNELGDQISVTRVQTNQILNPPKEQTADQELDQIQSNIMQAIPQPGSLPDGVTGMNPSYPIAPAFTPEQLALAQQMMSPTSPFHNRPLVPFMTQDGQMIVPVPVPVPYHAMPPPPHHPVAAHPYFLNGGIVRQSLPQKTNDYKLTKNAETKRKDRPYKCNRCERSYKRLNTLRLHQNVHDEKFKCPHCGKCFDQRTKLMEHLHTHSTSKPLFCNFCGKNFVQKGNLRTHQIKYHEEELKLLEEAGLTNHVRNLLEPVDNTEQRKRVLQPPEFITTIPPANPNMPASRHPVFFTSERNVAIETIQNGFYFNNQQSSNPESSEDDLRPTFVIGNVTSLQKKHQQLPVASTNSSNVIDLTSDDNTEVDPNKKPGEEPFEAAMQTISLTLERKPSNDFSNTELLENNQDLSEEIQSEEPPISDSIDSEVIRAEDIPTIETQNKNEPEITSIEDISSPSGRKKLSVSEVIQMAIKPNHDETISNVIESIKTSEGAVSKQTENQPIGNNDNEVANQNTRIKTSGTIKISMLDQILPEIVNKTINKKKKIGRTPKPLLEVPILSTDSLGNNFKCEHCDKCFTDYDYLKSHQKIHLRIYKCDKCDRDFELEKSLKMHQNVHDEVYKCNDCGKCFAQKGELLSHVRVHTKPFVCGLCGERFTQNRDLKTHILWHNGKEVFKCNECEKCFTQKSSLRTHMNTHNGVKPFKCQACEKTFSLKGNLQKHLDLHRGLKPFQCPVCFKCFTQKHALQRHLTLHNFAQPFECVDCNKWFVRKDSYKQHLVACKKMVLYNTYGNTVVMQS